MTPTPPPKPERWVPPEAEGLTGIPGITVHSLIGSGGMGAVYRAHQAQLDRPVALKVARPNDSCSRAYAAHILHEAQVLAHLDHEHIVKIYDYGQREGLVWIVMELVDGASLRSLLRARQVSLELALDLARQLCDALAHAHARGVIHHDLKPENILVDGRNQAKIIDFGLANVASYSYTTARPGRLAGTPRYIAPEQFSGARRVDHRADIYALGVVMYEMMTGGLPPAKLPPSAEFLGVDEHIDRIVRKCLARNPNDRWQSGDEVWEALSVISGADLPASGPAALRPAFAINDSSRFPGAMSSTIRLPEQEPAATTSLCGSGSATASAVGSSGMG